MAGAGAGVSKATRGRALKLAAQAFRIAPTRSPLVSGVTSEPAIRARPCPAVRRLGNPGFNRAWSGARPRSTATLTSCRRSATKDDQAAGLGLQVSLSPLLQLHTTTVALGSRLAFSTVRHRPEFATTRFLFW